MESKIYSEEQQSLNYSGRMYYCNVDRAISPWASALKRGFDIVASVLGFILASPLFLIIYVAIKLEDGGNVIFRQERVGYRGKIFTLYKLNMTASRNCAGKMMTG